jgi:hypothetical protein
MSSTMSSPWSNTASRLSCLSLSSSWYDTLCFDTSKERNRQVGYFPLPIMCVSPYSCT